MEIEKLEVKDIEQFLKLCSELVSMGSDVNKTIDLYKEMLKDPNYLIAVAKDGDKLIGTMQAIVCKAISMNGKNFLVIEDVIVDKSYRGKGIGKELMNYIDNFARENNCYYSILVSSGFRKGAHKFYEAVGFTEDVRGFRKYYE